MYCNTTLTVLCGIGIFLYL